MIELFVNKTLCWCVDSGINRILKMVGRTASALAQRQ